jgi:CubicO group peptidase (beta-lactamase class C family)
MPSKTTMGAKGAGVKIRLILTALAALSLASCSRPSSGSSADHPADPSVPARATTPPPLVVQAHGAVLVPATPHEAGLSEATVRSAVAFYRDAIDKGKAAGAVLLIARHGKVVVHEAFGLRDVQARSPMERTAMFRMSSNTKAVTAAAVALLADRGRVRFTDPVRVHIPSWNNRRARAITIHQLLSHTSGIRIDALFAPRWIQWPWSGPPTLRTETDRIGRVGAEASPGGSYFYTNAGYNAMGGLIEAISGRPLEVFLRDEIFRPLGMSDSYSIEGAEKLEGKSPRMGPTYVPGERGGWTVTWRPGDRPEVPFARGSGGLVTTAWDYAVFMQMLLNGGIYGDVRLLRPETVRAMLTVHTPSGARGYGYGWGINDDGIFTHSGSTGTYAWGDPHRGIIVVAFTQTPPASDLRSQLMEILNRAQLGSASVR